VNVECIRSGRQASQVWFDEQGRLFTAGHENLTVLDGKRANDLSHPARGGEPHDRHDFQRILRPRKKGPEQLGALLGRRGLTLGARASAGDEPIEAFVHRFQGGRIKIARRCRTRNQLAIGRRQAGCRHDHEHRLGLGENRTRAIDDTYLDI
jgi:hypothetical protein